ncbi:MAG TPA: hypothetical protein VFR03_13765 [Thermoanaerobaculia bacterium]|nr:hypothetical protein [Thermoanaerobaculia bacterium]
MKSIVVRSLLLLALLPGPLAAKQAEKQPEPPASSSGDAQTIRYEIRSLDLHAAEVLAWDQCARKESCRVASTEITGRKYLEVRAEPAVQEKIARALAREDQQARTHGFQILLLAASLKPGGGGTEVPANVQKALADLKGFLPYKGYEVLDTAWLSGTQDRGMEARLVDRQGAGYQVALQFHDVGSSTDRSLFVDVFRLKAEPFKPQGTPEMRPGGSLIDTSFGVKEGETIVVGTSKTTGSNEALVVLVTAVAAP